MKLFDFLKKKKISYEEQQDKQEINLSWAEKIPQFDGSNLQDGEAGMQYIQSCCEQIQDAEREVNDAKREYQMVTSYLNDIQEIENLPTNNREELLDLSRQIQTLNEERKSFQTTAGKLSEAQFYQIQQNEDEMPKVLMQLREREDYLTTVKGDLNHLEGERGYQMSRKRNLLQSQQNMKGFSIITILTLVITFGMLVILHMFYKMEINSGYQVAVFCGAIVAMAICLKMYYNSISIRKAGHNINRAITLLNRVKIKYVNSANAVEYLYEKYRIENSYELNYLWEQYRIAKVEKEKYSRTADDLDYFNEQLIGILKKYKLYDPSVWIHQTHALLKNTEMVEIRHQLVERRRNLRKRIEYNTTNKNETKDNLQRLVAKYPQYEEEVSRRIRELKL